MGRAVGGRAAALLLALSLIHILKTPLTVILANTGLVLSHPEDTVAAQSKWLEYTHDEAEQMKELVDDLLFLAKSDAARQPAARAETAMSEVALGCLLPFESVAFEAVSYTHLSSCGGYSWPPPR